MQIQRFGERAKQLIERIDDRGSNAPYGFQFTIQQYFQEHSRTIHFIARFGDDQRDVEFCRFDQRYEIINRKSTFTFLLHLGIEGTMINFSDDFFQFPGPYI